jgi:molecular chaperone GrpE
MSEEPDISPELEEKLSEQAILQQALEETRHKASDYYDQLLRLRAEFDNFRKRSEREKADARMYGKQEVLMPILSLIDVFEQALAQARAAKDHRQVVKGLEMLHKNFGQFLKTEGIEALSVVGKPFDPQLSEAVEQQETDDGDVGKVLGEIQRGYAYRGQVLRPSRVRVGVARKGQAGEQASKRESGSDAEAS